MRILYPVFLALVSFSAQAAECDTNLPNGATRADLNAVLGCLNSRIDETAATAGAVDGRLSDATGQVDDKLAAMEKQIDSRLARMDGKVQGGLDKMDKNLQNGLSALDTNLQNELSAIVTRIAEIEKKGMSKRVRVANRCLAIDRIQMCWGAQQLAIPSTNRHTRSFDFTFEKPFADTPRVITNGVNANTKGKAFAVFEWRATTTGYSGLLNNVENDNNTNEAVTMNYLAIGQAGSW